MVWWGAGGGGGGGGGGGYQVATVQCHSYDNFEIHTDNFGNHDINMSVYVSA